MGSPFGGSASIKVSPAAHQLNGRIGVAKQLWDWGKEARSWYQQRTRWTVSVPSTDVLFDVVNRWFTDLASADAAPQALSARINKNPHPSLATAVLLDTDSKDAIEPPDAVELYYDVRKDRKVQIGGHTVTVTLSKPDVPSLGNKGNDDWMRYLQPDIIYFHARSRSGQHAVIQMLEQLASQRNKRKPALFLLNSWGSWSRRDDLPPRTLDSVVLAPGQMERIRDDLSRFLDSEGEYNRRGIPWHRGYLLSGPPGTGKTSVVRALAAHFDLDLWYAPLGDLSKDTSLLSLINQVDPHSILLLEDIDVFQAARERDDENNKVSMAGLLNALDGVATPHGLISILTSNHADVIDPALLRPGRVDLREQIGMPDQWQLARHWAQFYSRASSPLPAPVNRIQFIGTTADAAELFKTHLDDPDAAWTALTRADK